VKQVISPAERGLLSPRLGKAGSILPASFYNRETELVARDLLGAVLQCKTADGAASGIIVETEA
jgi:3-methyladenine DNA glycosylase Mpg